MNTHFCFVAFISCPFSDNRDLKNGTHRSYLHIHFSMPNFNPSKPFGEKCSTDNDTQAGFVPPEISKKLPIYGKVKGFLGRYGVDVPVTEESGNLVARRLICRVWSEPEFENDRREAFEAFDSFRQKKIDSSVNLTVRPSAVPTQSVRISSQTSNRQISNDVAKRFSNEKSKFGGTSNECWSKYLESYNRMSVEIELSNELKKTFFHHACITRSCVGVF